MSDTSQIQKEYCSQALAAAIVIALIFLAAGAKPVAKGMVLGTLFSIINFILMAQALPLKINKSRRKIFIICLGGIWFRYALIAIPLVIAIKLNSFNFFAVVMGVFMVQGIILARHIGEAFFVAKLNKK